MTETTEEKVKRIVMNQEGLKILDIIKGDFHDCISELAGHGVSTTTIATLVNAHTSLTEEIQVTKAQVSSLTKERYKAIKLATLSTEALYQAKIKLSNREKEIEELKDQLNERYVFKEDGFDNYEFVDFLYFKKERAKYIKRHFKWENEVFQEITYGAERWVYYTFDGQDCHFFWNRQEALASLNKEGESK